MARFTSALVLFGICSLLPALSRADTFTVYDLTTAVNTTRNGIDVKGEVLITDLRSGSPVYELYNGSTLLSSSTVYPASFVTDNGFPEGGGRSLAFAVENSGYEAYQYNGLNEFGVSGPPSPLYLSYPGPPRGYVSFDGFTPNGYQDYINSVGDFVFEDLATLEQIEIVHTPGSGTSGAVTPEPSSFALLGTGVLATATMLRRRSKLA